MNLFDEFTGRLDIAGSLGIGGDGDVPLRRHPGESLPCHYEYVEEWLLVVDGAVVVRTPGGDQELRRGDLVRYPAGPEGAHQVANRSDVAARVMLFRFIPTPTRSASGPATRRSTTSSGEPAVPRDVG